MEEKKNTPKRIRKIVYWIATLWLALGMVSTAVAQMMEIPDVVHKMEALGYPLYIFQLIGVLKILGVLVLLLPKMHLIKEWAYAGFFFLMVGALYSHLSAGDPMIESIGPSLLLVLCGVSWYFRPDNRKLSSLNN